MIVRIFSLFLILLLNGEGQVKHKKTFEPVLILQKDSSQYISKNKQRRYFNAPKIVGKEDEFCRRAYRIMLRGAVFTKDLYKEWPSEPACGYIGWGGSTEKEIDANIGIAHLYAMLINFGEYDEQVTGIPRQEVLRRIKGVIRYCCFTHYTGSYTCTNGKQWGGGWHDASWSSVFAHSVWLMWPKLDNKTREMATRVIIAEADRFLGVDPPSGKINDTKAESNAWNSRAINIAAVMFPKHPHASEWRQASSRWMMNTFSIATDKFDSTVVDGKTVHSWITTENIHPDFTLENHKIVYPVYMWASLLNLCYSASYNIFVRQEPPQAAFHHLVDVYVVYKKLQTWEGLPAYINGSDKFLHMQVVDIFVHSFFAQVLNDSEAAHLESVELDIIEKMQARFKDGRIYPIEEVGPWSRVHNLSSILGGSYLLHYVRQSDVKPISGSEFERRISGVSYFPYGKFILHRTQEKLVTFAWSKPYRIMGLAIPRQGSWLVTPHIQGFTGELLEEGKDREPPFDVKSLTKNISDNSFIVSGIALRCDGKVEYSWTFESLPNNEVLMRQKLIAVSPITLMKAETGTIGIGRELGSDYIELVSYEGVKVLGGLSNSDDETYTFSDGQVTVGGRFTYQWTGTGSVSFFKNNKVSQVYGAPGGYGRIEDRLAVCHIKEPRKFNEGEIIAEGELRIIMHVIP